MTTYDLGLLPSGRLHCFPSNADDATTHDIGERLFTLAARKNSTGLGPSLQYWRNFARQYMSERCLMPRVALQRPEPVKPLTDIETMPLLMGAPPMRGAEYLSGRVLASRPIEILPPAPPPGYLRVDASSQHAFASGTAVEVVLDAPFVLTSWQLETTVGQHWKSQLCRSS